MLRAGTAGWSFPDWEGIVYPRGFSRSAEALALMSRMFQTLEANVTFYRPPTRRMAEAWVRCVASSAQFRFTAKLWRGFTHDRETDHPGEEKAFKEGLALLVESGRLGALLAQFPHSFKKTPSNLSYLQRLLDRFQQYPLAVEVRHASWLDERFLAMLDARGAGFCNVDQPLLGSASPPTSIMTGGIGYVRLHGRNRQNWFKKDAGRDARYDYLYSEEEIQEWAERIKLMRNKAAGRGSGDIFIIANNHYRGQAPANALELMHRISGQRVEIPETLVEAYPRLARIALKIEKPGMLPL